MINAASTNTGMSTATQLQCMAPVTLSSRNVICTAACTVISTIAIRPAIIAAFDVVLSSFFIFRYVFVFNFLLYLNLEALHYVERLLLGFGTGSLGPLRVDRYPDIWGGGLGHHRIADHAHVRDKPRKFDFVYRVHSLLHVVRHGVADLLAQLQAWEGVLLDRV